MKKEQIMDFTRRISQSNRGGLVIVIYDIFFAYIEDAKEAYDNKAVSYTHLLFFHKNPGVSFL